jgi:hypothetical protein
MNISHRNIEKLKFENTVVNRKGLGLTAKGTSNHQQLDCLCYMKKVNVGGTN